MNDGKKLVNKDILDSKFEILNFEKNFKELENLDDLWYFVKSSAAAWITGSAS